MQQNVNLTTLKMQFFDKLPGQTWELTLFSCGNNNNKKNRRRILHAALIYQKNKIAPPPPPSRPTILYLGPGGDFMFLPEGVVLGLWNFACS